VQLPWTAGEKLELRRSLNLGSSLETIAAILGREPEDIRSQVREAGLDDARLFPRDIAAS